jgi:uncharacterized protein
LYFTICRVSPKDWTLLVVAAAEGRPLTPVQLQKALFLIARNLTNEQRETALFYNFKPYDYGPFDQHVYQDAEQLRNEGLIIIDPSSGVTYRDYTATPLGLKSAQNLRSRLESPVCDYLDRVVAWVRSLSFNALVQAIYRHYPEMRANSVFRD